MADHDLINWAKTQLPDPETYFVKCIAPHHFGLKKKVLFKKVVCPEYGAKWEFVEVLPIK